MKWVIAFAVGIALAIVLVLWFTARKAAGPLVEVSRPNAVGSCNDSFNLFGNWPIDEAVEPFVAVNPIHPNNIVSAWMQGPFQNVIAAVSNDGGKNWQKVPIPLTVCSGGSFLATGDPWLSFARNGDLYAVAVVGNANSMTERSVVVTKSGDGGLHWSTASVLPGSATVDAPPDHPSLTADSTDARLVYAIWGGHMSPNNGAAVFARTTDGGVTWEQARAIVQTAEQSDIQFSQILVLPNGTLVDIYELRVEQPDKSNIFTLQTRRSTDHGQTWSAPAGAVTVTAVYRADGWQTLVVDPKNGKFVQNPTNPSFAVDSRNGNLYAVWGDGRFSNFQYNDIAFSMSADGGSTWSAPTRVNRTPLTIPAANRQAFLPSIAVATDGTFGVSYYDFRFNDSKPGLPTDYWLVRCHPSSTNSPSDSACWRSEVRLTNSSFNMEAVIPNVPMIKNDFFLGDYFGLANTGDDFVAVFAQPDKDNVTSIFARRTGP